MTLGELALVEWRNPWWLLLALQPLVIAVWLNLRRPPIAHYAEASLWPWALRGAERHTRVAWRRIATWIVWALIAVAAAGPRLPLGVVESGATSVPYHGGDLMVVLDVSPGMTAGDIAPSRLQRAQLELHDLLQRLRGERIGLVVFSSSAGLLAPLTSDYAAFTHYFALADAALFKTPGTQYAAALDLARQNLPPQNEAARAVLLITAGEPDALSGVPGADALAAARRLKESGVGFYVLAVGLRDGVALHALTEAGDGTFAEVSDGESDWRALYDRGLLLLPGKSHPLDALQRWRELYPAFLCAALILLLVSVPVTSAPAVAAGVFAFLLLGGQSEPVAAAETDHTHAWRAYRNGDFVQAQILFSELPGYDARMGAGAAAYRRKYFAAAIDQFIAALPEAVTNTQRADALFNLGNGYFQAADFRAAADAFTEVLRLRPGDPRAQHNLDLATARLKQARAADPNAVGVLGRRGPQTGGVLGEEIGDRPVMLEPTVDEESKVVAGAPSARGEQARSRTPVANSGTAYRADAADRLYRAGLKKLELAADRPADMLREMIKRDTSRMTTPP